MNLNGTIKVGLIASVFAVTATTTTPASAADDTSKSEGTTAAGSGTSTTSSDAASSSSKEKGSSTGIQPGSHAEKLQGPKDFPPDVVVPPGGKTKGVDALKKSVKAIDEKAAFKAWFDKFFSAMYYAKTVADVKPYFANRMTRTWDNIDPARQQHLLWTVKALRATSPSITAFSKGANGAYYDLTIEGDMAPDGRKGRGATLYRLVKEGGSWKIDTFKGKQWARPEQ